MINLRWTKALAAVGLIVGATLFWTAQHRVQTSLRQENESLRRQIDRFAQVENDNERLSNLVAQVDGDHVNQQLMELLRLRNEVGQLRRQTSELKKFEEQNKQLQTGNEVGNGSQATNSPPTTQPLAIYPKAAWAFAGYATPEDAFQSLNWAALEGDITTLKAGLSVEGQKEFAKQFENKSDPEVVAEIKQRFTEKTEARIVSKDMISDSFAVLVVSGGEADTKDRQDKLIFQKIDGQWKLVSDH